MNIGKWKSYASTYINIDFDLDKFEPKAKWQDQVNKLLSDEDFLLRAEKVIPENGIRNADYSLNEHDNEKLEKLVEFRSNNHVSENRSDDAVKKICNKNESNGTIPTTEETIRLSENFKTNHTEIDENQNLTYSEEQSKSLEIISCEKGYSGGELDNAIENNGIEKDKDFIDQLIKEEENVSEKDSAINEFTEKENIADVDVEIANMMEEKKTRMLLKEVVEDDVVCENENVAENEESKKNVESTDDKDKDEKNHEENESFETEANEGDKVFCTNEDLAILETPGEVETLKNSVISDVLKSESMHPDDKSDEQFEVDSNAEHKEDLGDSERPSSPTITPARKPIDEAALYQLAANILDDHEKEEKRKAEDRQKVDELIQDLSFNIS